MEPTLGTTVCLICFEMTEKLSFVPFDVTGKMINCCATYLHSILTKETLKNDVQLNNENHMPLCKNCFDSAVELTQLSEQLTSIQKHISDLAFAFSMAAFHRRSQVYSLSQNMQNDCENSSSTIEFYEVCLPPNLFPIANKDNNIHHKKINHEEVIGSLHTKTDIPNMKLESSADQLDYASGYCQSLTANEDSEIQFNLDKHSAIELNQNLASINEISIVHVAESNEQNNCTDGGIKITMTELLKSVKLPRIRLERIKIEGDKDDASVVTSYQTTEEPLQNIFDNTQFKDGGVSDPSYVPDNSEIEKQLKCFYCEKTFSREWGRTRHHMIHTGDMPHKCSFCKKRFTDKSRMKRHERIHTGKRPFKCGYCEKAFALLQTMKNHEATHDEVEKPYKCSYCEKCFILKYLLEGHERSHTGEKPFECSLCHKRFYQARHRNQHEKRHNEKKSFKCCIKNCEVSFTSRFALRNHERRHTGEKPYKCVYCEKMFTRLSSKSAHQKTHKKRSLEVEEIVIKIESDKDCASVDNSCQTTDEPLQNILEDTQFKDGDVSDTLYVPNNSEIEKQLKCFYCEKSFSREWLRARHHKIHTGEYTHKCSVCKKGYADKSRMERHEKIHTGEKPFKCAYCEKSFVLFHTMKCHEATHDEVENPYKCSYCEKSFIVKHLLQGHERSHTGEKPFECSLCDKKFTQAGHRNHHEKLHSGEKPFKCSFQNCVVRFTSKFALQTHERRHTGEKPYKCMYCEKCFLVKNLLEVHERSHTGVNPFQCSVCKKGFSLKQVRDRHETIHTGETPFECSVCKKRFTLKHVRDQHEKSHTGEKPFECSVCKKRFAYKHGRDQHEKLHTGERPYKCSFCEKCFAVLDSKRRHEFIHANDKPFKCSYCEKSFAKKCVLKYHESVHTGEKPYKCLYCEKMFARLSSKAAHQKTHKKRSLEVCSICNLKCDSPAHLLDHEKTHGQTSIDFKCSFCEMMFSKIEDRNIHEKMHSKEKETENEDLIVGI